MGHNEDSARYLANRVLNFGPKRCHIVVGMLKDKNIEQSLRCVESSAAKASYESVSWYCASLPTARGEQATRLIKALDENTKKQAYDSLETALSNAIEQASNTDMIVVFGSFVTVSLALSYLKTVG